MSLWERFSRIIYRSITASFLKRYQNKTIESVLKKSTSIIDSDTISEVKHHLTNSLTKDGAFPDRGGKSDIYYTMFGCFVAEALSMNEIFPNLKDYVRREVTKESLSGIDLYCGAILYSKLNGFDDISERLKLKVKNEIEAEVKAKINEGINTGYTSFIGLLAFYYLHDYRSILKFKERINLFTDPKEMPCSLAAAETVVNRILGKTGKSDDVKLRSFYRGNGGFVALKNAPVTDLLSTAVALYALQFVDSDLKDIKPDCLTFVDGLYLNGGFRATNLDFDIDIEYTFYGLLALGALTS